MTTDNNNTQATKTIKVVEEHLEVGKRIVEGDEVVVNKRIISQPEKISVELNSTGYDSETVVVNREISEVPQISVTDDTIIVPVVEEQVVVTKKLVLKEEIHLRKRTITSTKEETVDVRTTKVSIERK